MSQAAALQSDNLSCPQPSAGGRMLVMLLLVLIACQSVWTAEPSSIVQVEADNRSGTAFLIRKDDKFAIFCSCYHIFHSTKYFNLKCDDVQITESERNDVEVDVSPETDTVLIRIPIARLAGVNLESIENINRNRVASTEIAPRAHRVNAVESPLLNCTAIGFPGIISRPTTFTVSNLRVLGQLGEDNQGLSGPDFVHLLACSGDFMYPGMSGGPVFDNQHRLVGMIFGATENFHGLIVPSTELFRKLDAAHFVASTPNAFQPPQALNETSKKFLASQSRSFSADKMDFSKMLSAIELLSEGNAEAKIQKFHEIQMPIGFSRTDSFTIDSVCQEDQTQTFRLNGTLVDPGKELKLSEGDNLLIIRSRKVSGNELSINSLFSSGNRIQVTITNSKRQTVEIYRSVPSLINDYSIFVTITTPRKARTRSNFQLNLTSNAIANLLALEANQWCFPISKSGQGSIFIGKLGFPDNPITLESVSGQTLDLRLKYKLKVDSAIYSMAGISLRLPENSEISGQILGRAQASNDMKGIALRCATATGPQLALTLAKGSNDGSPAISLDVSGIVRQSLASHINMSFLHPETVHALSDEFCEHLFSEYGIIPKLLKPKAIHFDKEPLVNIDCDPVDDRNQYVEIAPNLTMDSCIVTISSINKEVNAVKTEGKVDIKGIKFNQPNVEFDVSATIVVRHVINEGRRSDLIQLSIDRIDGKVLGKFPLHVGAFKMNLKVNESGIDKDALIRDLEKALRPK